MRSDLEHLRSVFMAVENGDLGMLKSLGIKDSELGDVKFFLEKLVNTGFLDWIAPESASDYYQVVQFAPLSSSFYSYLPYDSRKYKNWSTPNTFTWPRCITSVWMVRFVGLLMVCGWFIWPQRSDWFLDCDSDLYTRPRRIESELNDELRYLR